MGRHRPTSVAMGRHRPTSVDMSRHGPAQHRTRHRPMSPHIGNPVKLRGHAQHRNRHRAMSVHIGNPCKDGMLNIGPDVGRCRLTSATHVETPCSTSDPMSTDVDPHRQPMPQTISTSGPTSADVWACIGKPVNPYIRPLTQVSLIFIVHPSNKYVV